MQYLPDDVGSLQLLDLFDDEVMSFLGLAACFLLDGASVWSHCQLVLNHLPGDPGKLGWFPREHIGVLE